MGKFTIDDLKFTGPKYRSSDKTTTLSFRVWMGHCMITINPMDRNQKPMFNKTLKDEEIFLVTKYMSDLLKAEPGQEKTLVYNTYNFKEKQRKLEYVLLMKKDEKKIYHLIIKFGGNTYDFPIINIAAFDLGTGAIPDDERSYVTFCHLIHHLKNVVPIQTTVSSFPIETNNGYRRGGGSGYSGQGDFQSSSKNLPSDDDIFSQE